jgi:itaconyl-CoA hydratase
MTQPERTIKAGWQGRFFEDFTSGDVYRSPSGRTVTELDNSLFTHLTLNTNPLHFDAEYAGRSKWGKVLVNSTFTLGLVTGMSVSDVSQNAVANLGWENVRLPNPVFVGDTLYCETEVVGKRESKSHPEAGIVTVRSRGINQDGKVVIDFTRHVMVYKAGSSPARDAFPEVEDAADRKESRGR